MKHLSTHQIFKLCLILPVIAVLCSFLLSPGITDAWSQFRLPPFTPKPGAFLILMILFTLPNSFPLSFLARSIHFERNKALKLFLVSYFFLFFWPILLFEYQVSIFALVWTVTLNLINGCLFLQLFLIRPKSAFWLLPYLLWCVFLCCLNLGILILN